MSAEAAFLTNNSFRNVLGILSGQDNYKFKPERLLEITGYNKASLAKELSSSRPLMYRDEVDLRAMKQLREGVHQLVITSDLIFELYKFNDPNSKDVPLNNLSKEIILKLKAETERWIMAPNQLLLANPHSRFVFLVMARSLLNGSHQSWDMNL